MGSLAAEMENCPKYFTSVVQGSSAHTTATWRLPAILQGVIDTNVRQRHFAKILFGQDGSEDLEDIVLKLNQIKNRILEEKPLSEFSVSLPNGQLWPQKFYSPTPEKGPTWLAASFLHSECQTYKAMADVFRDSQFFKNFDPFRFQKEQAFVGYAAKMEALGSFLLETLADFQTCETTDNEVVFVTIESFFLTSLWGNKCDLALTPGQHIVHHTHELEYLKTLNNNIVVNDILDVCKLLISMIGTEQRVDIVMDNVGMEMFSDLCLADVLLELNVASSVHFHVKNVPWYISDVTPQDFNWTLELLSASERASLQKLGQKWQSRLDNGQFVLKTHDFWTTCHGYAYMSALAPDLYEDLSCSALVIFKGDLNYRKLVDDRKWESTTPFSVSLRGFTPAPLVTLRTIKFEVVTGMAENQTEKLDKTCSNWMLSSDFAVIQFCHDKNNNNNDSNNNNTYNK